MKNRQKWAPASLYVLAGLLVVSFFSQPIKEYYRLSSEDARLRIMAMPYAPEQEIEKRISEISVMIEEAERNPNEYFKLLSEINYLEKLATTFEQVTRDRYGISEETVHAVNMYMDVMELRNRIGWHLQPEFMAGVTDRGVIDAARTMHLKESDPLLSRETFVSYEQVWAMLFMAYFLTGLLAAPIFFATRLRRKGLQVHLEPHRMVLYCALWPYGFFVYPTNITKAKQFKDFVQFVSYLAAAAVSLFAPGLATAQTKNATPVNKKGDNQEYVLSGDDFIVFKDGPEPNLLPTISLRDTDINVFGWSQFGYDESSYTKASLRSLRLRTTVSREKVGLFFDGNLNGTFDVAELTAWYKTESGVKIEVGHLFHKAAFAAPAPFLQETIASPRVPVDFYAPGIAISGALNELWSFAFDITGESGHAFGSPDGFNSLEFSGYVQKGIQGGFIRYGMQSKPGSTRVIVDSTVERKNDTYRGALYVGDKGVGGYAFYQRKLADWFGLYGQVDYADDVSFLTGLRIFPGDNISFNLEQDVTDGAVAARLQLRF